jgi:hypothetical protein
MFTIQKEHQEGVVGSPAMSNDLKEAMDNDMEK